MEEKSQKKESRTFFYILVTISIVMAIIIVIMLGVLIFGKKDETDNNGNASPTAFRPTNSPELGYVEYPDLGIKVLKKSNFVITDYDENCLATKIEGMEEHDASYKNSTVICFKKVNPNLEEFTSPQKIFYDKEFKTVMIEGEEIKAVSFAKGDAAMGVEDTEYYYLYDAGDFFIQVSNPTSIMSTICFDTTDHCEGAENCTFQDDCSEFVSKEISKSELTIVQKLDVKDMIESIEKI